MKKNKLNLDNLLVKSFVTTLDGQSQKKVLGGDTTSPITMPITQRSNCDESIDPFECGRTGEDDCSQLMTNDTSVCDEILN